MMIEKIVKILREYKDEPELVITSQTTFEELKLDSLDTVELVMKIEEEFSVTIEMDENLKSVGHLIERINKAKE